MKRFLLGMAVCLLFISSGSTQPYGIFTDAANIGEPALEGVVSVDGGNFEIDAVGTGIGRRVYKDQFYFIYKEMSGSFEISGEPFPASTGEVGLMIRNSVDPSAAHISFLMFGDTPVGGNTNAVFGSVIPYIRSLDGGGTIVDGDIENGYTDNHQGKIRLVRMGSSVHLYTNNGPEGSGDWILLQSEAAYSMTRYWQG